MVVMMRETSWRTHLLVAVYALFSLAIFERVYETSKSVIDELFHVEQGLTYCYGFYQEWNQKITTFPGLYVLTIFLPRCSLYALRMIPLVCSIINFYLIAEIKAFNGAKSTNALLLDTLSLILLPPMYFFAMVYYTDVPSITSLLLTINFSMKERHLLSALCGALSVLMRQTNIVWVSGIFGTCVVESMIKRAHPHMKCLREASAEHLYASIKTHLKQPSMLLGLITSVLKSFYGYILVILGFLLFLLINGSIVVGDKQAHQATIHIPQFFFFSLFSLVFGSSMWLPNVKQFVRRHVGSARGLLGILIASLVMAAIIRYNTVVHSYLLADNRHYTFYIWNRLYSRNQYFRYLIIPVYVFGLYNVFAAMQGSIGFKIFFVISSFLTFCLQSLVEVRYFLIPFLILRLHKTDIKVQWSAMELLLNILINCLAFRVFFSIETKWPEFEEPQRIIW